MKTSITPFSILFGLTMILFSSCSKGTDTVTPFVNPNPNDTTNSTLVATWQTGHLTTDYTLYMPAAKTYNISQNGVNLENGTFSFNDSLITFNPIKSTSFSCTGKSGTYRYKIVLKSLTLTKKTDLCTKRLPVLALAWAPE